MGFRTDWNYTGYNLKEETKDLCIQYENTVHHPTLNRLIDESDAIVKKISLITKFTDKVHQQIAETTKNGKEPRLDFSKDPELMDLVDEVKDLIGFDSHKYTWNGQGDVDALLQITESQSKMFYQSLSPIYMKMQNQFDNVHHIYEVCSNLEKQVRNLMDRINSNIGRG